MTQLKVLAESRLKARIASGSDQRGYLMLIVCVLLLILISAAYLFSERMLISNVASTGSFQRRKAVSLSESGVAYVRASLQAAMATTDRVKWPDRWRGEVTASGARPFGDFQISYWDDSSQAWQLGVSDESCKLNLNQLPLDTLYGPEARRMLMCVPGMTLRLADSILDWMDEDEIQREYGAESSFYQSQQPSRSSRNGRLKSVSDLCGVRGITPEVLYGELGRSGWEEFPRLKNTESAMRRPEGGTENSSSLKIGLSAYLTVHGGMTVFGVDGKKRVLVNQDDLVSLYDELALILGDDVATYLVAYRMVGPKDKTLLAVDEYEIDKAEQTQRRAIRQANAGDDAQSENPFSAVERKGGLTIDKEGVYLIRSAYDVIGVDVEYRSKEGSILLKSPWPDNEQTFRNLLPALNQELSFLFGTPIMAQVNVNQSPTEVLQSIPGISTDLTRQIAIYRDKLGIHSESGDSALSEKRYLDIDWLRSSGVLSLKEMRVFAPYLTNLGTAFRFVSTGMSYPNGQSSHQQVVLDYRYPFGRVMDSRVGNLREMLSSGFGE